MKNTLIAEVNEIMPKAIDELKTWRVATFVMVVLAVSVFYIQRFVTQIFDVAFEICIFHVPTMVITVYVAVKQRMRYATVKNS